MGWWEGWNADIQHPPYSNQRNLGRGETSLPRAELFFLIKNFFFVFFCITQTHTEEAVILFILFLSRLGRGRQVALAPSHLRLIIPNQPQSRNSWGSRRTSFLLRRLMPPRRPASRREPPHSLQEHQGKTGHQQTFSAALYFIICYLGGLIKLFCPLLLPRPQLFGPVQPAGKTHFRKQQNLDFVLFY